MTGLSDMPSRAPPIPADSLTTPPLVGFPHEHQTHMTTKTEKTEKSPAAPAVPSLRGIYDRYAVTIEFTTDLEGGVPTNREMIQNWVRARMKKAGRDVGAEELEKLVNETAASVPFLAEREATNEVVADSLLWNTFKRGADARSPVFESRCLKAAFKEQANILKNLLNEEAKAEGRGAKKKKDGTEGADIYNTMYRSKVAENLFVEGDGYPIMRDGKPLEDVDGKTEKAIHVMTPQGPRSALKRYDFIKAGCQLTFNVRTLRGGVVTEHDLLRMLEFGQDNGLGSGRSQGAGQYKVLSVEELTPTEATPLFIKRAASKKA
jgi:hypothetical protein